MNTEIQTIINNLNNILNGQPWYGKPLDDILSSVKESNMYIQPNHNSHSLADLLYHMVTWAEFVQHRIEKKPIDNMAEFDALDWRPIDPAQHDWKKGVAALQAAHYKIIELLEIRKDIFLEEIVDYRKYNFRDLLNGLIQHNIYHLGQVAYLNKLMTA